MKVWNVRGFSLVEILVSLGIASIALTAILSQQKFMFDIHKSYDTSLENVAFKNKLVKAFSRPDTCSQSLRELGVMNSLETLLPNGSMEIQNGSIALGVEGTESVAIKSMIGQNSSLDKVIARGVSQTELILDLYLKKEHSGSGIETVTRSVYVSLFNDGSGWNCQGENDASELYGKLVNFCTSLEGTYSEESGACEGAVTPAMLERMCNTMEGASYADGVCTGVPGTAVMAQVCASIDGVYNTATRNCDLSENGPDMKNEALCVSMGGSYSIVSGCSGVDDHIRRRLCEDGLGGTYTNGGVCDDAIGGTFDAICDAMDGDLSETASSSYDGAVCSNMFNKSEMAKNLCGSVAGADLGSTDTNCGPVQEKFLNDMCGMLGGKLEGPACNGVKEPIAEALCRSMDGSYSNGSNGPSCGEVFGTFGDFCTALRGEYGSNGSCTNVASSLLGHLCDVSEGFRLTEDGSCERTAEFKCSGGEILVGGTRCENVFALFENSPFLPEFGGACGPGEFIKQISGDGVECYKPERYYYLSMNVDNSTPKIIRGLASAPSTHPIMVAYTTDGQGDLRDNVYRDGIVRFTLPGGTVLDSVSTSDVSPKEVESPVYYFESSKNRAGIKKARDKCEGNSNITNQLELLKYGEHDSKSADMKGKLICNPGNIFSGFLEYRKPLKITRKITYQCEGEEDTREFSIEGTKYYYQINCRSIRGKSSEENASSMGKEHLAVINANEKSCSNDRVMLGIHSNGNSRPNAICGAVKFDEMDCAQ